MEGQAPQAWRVRGAIKERMDPAAPVVVLASLGPLDLLAPLEKGVHPAIWNAKEVEWECAPSSAPPGYPGTQACRASRATKGGRGLPVKKGKSAVGETWVQSESSATGAPWDCRESVDYEEKPGSPGQSETGAFLGFLASQELRAHEAHWVASAKKATMASRAHAEMLV